MRRFGQVLMVLGAAVGVMVGVAMLGHIGIASAPWLVNVALAKLGLVASGGRMARGAATVRLAHRRRAGEAPSCSAVGRSGDEQSDSI